MEVNCEGCAGCCLDWRPIAPERTTLDHERRGPREPLDDTYNLVPLTRDEVRGFVADGFGDALTPRLWRADDGEAAAVGGLDVAAIGGRPAFFVGLRKPPKPVAPFGTEPQWLEACVFLDPETLQCRIHGDDRYPDECASYPGHNLALDAKVFAHPDPDEIDGAVARIAAGETTPADRAAFVSVAAASSPGTLAVNDAKRADARDAVLAADSWVGRTCDRARQRAGEVGTPAAEGDSAAASAREQRAGAPATPGWDAVRETTENAREDGAGGKD
jgi:Fe-S-cluster containining protein